MYIHGITLFMLQKERKSTIYKIDAAIGFDLQRNCEAWKNISYVCHTTCGKLNKIQKK